MRRALLPLLLLCACSAGGPPEDPEPTARLVWSGDGALRLDGERLGSLRRSGPPWAPRSWSLEGDGLAVELTVEDTPLEMGQAYPRRVTVTGTMDSAPGFRQAWTLLAPPAPLPVEGYGLVVEEDPPGTNDAEHALLRSWLADQGLPADTRPFEELHRRETGRELRVFYEISGRRVDGVFSRVDDLDDPQPIAELHSRFRSEDGGLKIHHQRPGENGRFRYHRRSLELADVIAWVDSAPELHAHQCGCYGYAIAADYMTLGNRAYEVEADWLDDRVAAEFFIGLERRDGFPWLGLGDRRRMRDLARRARAWTLKDIEGRPFADVSLELPAAPPSPALGPIVYRVSEIDEDGSRRPVVRIDRDDEGVTVAFFHRDAPGAALERLDALLAAMPSQVMRGDGLRDSHLGEIEMLVDAWRLLEQPGEVRLADLVSDVDALTAVNKVHALLEPERFVAAPDALPPAPIPGPGATRRAAGPP